MINIINIIVLLLSQGGTIILLTDGEQTNGCLAIEDMIPPLVTIILIIIIMID